MDTLALLCNLYGDGPPTLRRLREAGCATLAALDSVESDRLASLLRTSARAARRFQVEGRLLRERSEALVERAPAPSAAVEAVQAAAPTPAPRASDPLIGKVLSAWRDRDDESSARAAPPAAPRASAPPASRSATGEPDGPYGPDGPDGPDGLGGLDGVDAALEAALESCGVRTLAQLVDADALKLASQGRVGFTRLLHLQFLARRELAQSARQRPRDDDVLVPQPPPGERRGAPRAAAAAAGAAPTPLGATRFSPADRPSRPADPEFELELERFAREARAALERDASGAPLADEGGSGPFA